MEKREEKKEKTLLEGVREVENRFAPVWQEIRDMETREERKLEEMRKRCLEDAI